MQIFIVSAKGLPIFSKDSYTIMGQRIIDYRIAMFLLRKYL